MREKEIEMSLDYDAIIIGGSFAGLSAAIHIARGRKSVCVIDTGKPRNRYAESSHGFFSRDGAAAKSMIAIARDQVHAYPSVTMVDGEAVEARQIESGFEVRLSGDSFHRSKRLVLAFGIVDELPDIPGLRSQWGKTVLHCPYCHGYELAEKKLGVLRTGLMSAHQAQLIAEWGPTTYFLDGGPMPDGEILERLVRKKVRIVSERVSSLVGNDTTLSSVQLVGGRHVELDALYLAPPSRLASSIADGLGCKVRDGPFGPIIETDENRMTSVPGVYAAGDIARAPHNATWAASDGVTAGTALHQSLVFSPAA